MRPVARKEGWFWPTGPFGRIWRPFGVRTTGGCCWHQWVEARDTASCPVTHRTVSAAQREVPVPDVGSAMVEIPWFRLHVSIYLVSLDSGSHTWAHISFRFSEAGVGPESWHFFQVPSDVDADACWSRNPTLRATFYKRVTRHGACLCKPTGSEHFTLCPLFCQFLGYICLESFTCSHRSH